ncbi:hypothetical protein BJF85_06470 [Saccharomonospora sp. CUA-673]|uniref:glycosyltransferase n=1 Tax=Saccharomonospora sp. CUA-673 TaxID=1904969 RepID=UPI0009677D20|nr:glycosyltransferase [Saccharomonospora sp. CUA-673]OLT39988.1 hypothetical protein BJF85_06470 [Saccharomonospora sp. CUA-673]
MVGSRGDVQPGLAVAARLRAQGHDVALGVAPNLVDLARGFGLDAVAVGVDSRDLLTSELVRRDMRSANPVRRVRGLAAVSAHGWDELRRGVVDLAADADVIVTGLLGQEVGSAVAEARDVAFAALHYAPVRANSTVPLIPLGARHPALRRVAWRAGEAVRWRLTKGAENRQRAALGLRPTAVDLPRRLRDRGAMEIQAYDPVLVPGLADEWGPRRPLVGSLDLPGADSTDAELLAWLDAGSAPVYIGFGSMPVRDPDALLDAVHRMCRELGMRALVAAGWSDVRPTGDDDRVRLVGSVEHAAVLPRCRVAVHHGGAGTTAAAVRAGIPSVVCSFSADQPMWGRLLAGRGVGVWMPFSRLDAGSLRDAVAELCTDEVAGRARGLSARMIPADTAVSTAAEHIVAAA